MNWHHTSFVAAVVLVVGMIALPAQAARFVYDNPYTNPDAVVDAEVAGINTATQGSTVNMVNPFMDKTFEQALEAAMGRGAIIHFVSSTTTWDRFPAGPRLKQFIVDSHSKSTFTLCKVSCYISAIKFPNAHVHAKTLQVVYANGSYKSFIGSNDVTPLVPGREFNTVAITTDPVIGRSIRTWIYGMRMKLHKVRAETTSGNLRMFLFPQVKDTAKNNFYTRALSGISCAHHSHIDLVTALWLSNIPTVATRLHTLESQGCRVRIIASQYRTNAPVRRLLKKYHLNVRWTGLNSKYGTVHQRSHVKDLMIKNWVQPKKRKHHRRPKGHWHETVYQGSLNMSLTMDQHDADNMLQVVDALHNHVYDNAEANFLGIWKYCQPMS